MAIDYIFSGDLLTLTYTGDTAPDTLGATWANLLADPAFASCRKILIDARHSEMNMSFLEIEARTQRMAQYEMLARIKWAVVAESNQLAFGLSRMFATLAEDIDLEVMVFRTIDQAMAWLSTENEGT